MSGVIAIGIYGCGMICGALLQSWWCSDKGHDRVKCPACGGAGRIAVSTPTHWKGGESEDLLRLLQGICQACSGRGFVR